VQVGETLVVETRPDWRTWLAANHATTSEIWLVSFRRSSSRRSVAAAAAAEEAICVGWSCGPSAILDADSWAVRYAPRKPDARWTELDLARARRLFAAGRLTIDGLAALPPKERTALVHGSRSR
jgi:uncharacterized protein YdeI (YjbR/CyaY-like superfamily)